ncbi:MAG: hypothetical protein GAK30_00598 [Paracidovorax wautersii]|uniref:Uncharacterized protein n=1 Tax=Paracidovorax wautersii TaxID=1177982 RepID=A0A7V8FRW0_9BURK|nr:MAG: hypothetical protein GAK30_00598 [Paracidovorax wautersii]
MSPHAAAFLTCVAAFAALALALVWLVPALGWGRALVAYSGHTSMAAGLVFVALLAWARWKVRRAPRRST